MSRPWRLRLTRSAERDLEHILRWSVEQFGALQARRYANTLSSALTALSEGPTTPGVRPRPEWADGLYALHVARRGRKGRHWIVFRVAPDQALEVLRILHDHMDPANHLPPGDPPANG